MTLIEIETSFGTVAASERALAEAIRDLLTVIDLESVPADDVA